MYKKMLTNMFCKLNLLSTTTSDFELIKTYLIRGNNLFLKD